jgi:hypothetical protein
LENLEIENVETIKDRKWRNVFWVGTQRYGVIKLHRTAGLQAGRIASYPYSGKGKHYCIITMGEHDDL